VSHHQLAAHLQVDRYGDFWLTDAIRPSLDQQIVPRQGYRIDTYRDAQADLKVPVLAASVSREHLFEVFLDLLEPLGDVVDVVLETSHDSKGTNHQDLYREHIDLPVLKSHLCEFEDLLLHDGCTGVAVIANDRPMEIQFEEHKLLVVYARDLQPFQTLLDVHNVTRDDRMKLITEGEHMHSTDQRFVDIFQRLCYRIGVGEAAEHVSW
jgi:hypothetical protein